MREIYFIGGSPCSGKSTIAEMIVSKYGFEYYKLDDFIDKYMKIAAKNKKAVSAKALALNFEQMWMREPKLQADEEIIIYEEIFPYALLDIKKIKTNSPIVAEGAGFLPKLISEQNIAKNRYISIVPTENFQRANYAKREWIGQFLSGCNSPEIAFDNWMARDAIFAEKILEQTKNSGYKSIIVNGEESIEDNFKTVVKAFEIK